MFRIAQIVLTDMANFIHFTPEKNKIYIFAVETGRAHAGHQNLQWLYPAMGHLFA